MDSNSCWKQGAIWHRRLKIGDKIMKNKWNIILIVVLIVIGFIVFIVGVICFSFELNSFDPTIHLDSGIFICLLNNNINDFILLKPP